MLLGNGIIVSDGAFWRRQRRMIQPAFSRKCIDGLAKKMQKANQDLLTLWQEKADKGEIIDVSSDTSDLSLEIILRCLFSDDMDKLIAQEGENPFQILTYDLARDIQFVMKFRALKTLVQQLIDLPSRCAQANLVIDGIRIPTAFVRIGCFIGTATGQQSAAPLSKRDQGINLSRR